MFSILQLEEGGLAISGLAKAVQIAIAERDNACSAKIIAVRPADLSSPSSRRLLYDRVLNAEFNALVIHVPASTFNRLLE